MRTYLTKGPSIITNMSVFKIRVHFGVSQNEGLFWETTNIS